MKASYKKALYVLLLFLSSGLYILTLMAAYGGYMDPQRWTLPSIAILFFPYLAMATLIVGAVWFFCRRYIEGCIAIAVLLACGPTFTEAMPFRFGNEPSNPERTFKMVTFNCLHLSDQKYPDSDFNRSINFLIHSGADFICLQELYGLGTPEVPKKFNEQLDSLFAVYPYRSNDWIREEEFISKYPFEQITVRLDSTVTYGSCAAYRLHFDNDSLTVINVHLPSYLLSNKERKIITEAKNEKGMKKSIKEFEGTVYQKMRNAFERRAEVSKAIAEFAEKTQGNVIVCGDFNDVPGSWSYRNFTKRGFEDAYAETGFGHLITYNQHLMWFHIDQVLYKGALTPLYVHKVRLNSSDHYPIVAEFEFL